MMRGKAITAFICFVAAPLSAAVPAGYYNSLDGKNGEELINAINMLSKGHSVVTYGGTNGKTWQSFEKTDVRMFAQQRVWWDMYSNNLVYITGYDAMNIEHAAANSWWGGRNGSIEAFSDLFLLNPADADTNNKKGDYPIGVVIDARIYDNGVSKIGTPAAGQGGGAASVFEPADEYKGDFARAYFYTFTAYNDLTSWKAESQYIYDDECRLQPWAAELLLTWHRADPVDTKELRRNEEIYKLQGNRNPFIDYPELAEYLWGDNKGENVDLSGMTLAQAVDRPWTPTFSNSRVVGVNTYSANWWNGFTQNVNYAQGDLYLSLDGRDYYKAPHDYLQFDPASTNESHIVKAYAEDVVSGYVLRSPVATLTLAARDPNVINYTSARWERFTADMNVKPEDEKWIILSSNTFVAMGWNGGTASNKYLPSAGLTEIEDDYLVELPAEAALVTFQAVGDGKYRMMISDMAGNYKGSWNATGKNAMRLQENTYTPGTWNMKDDDSFSFIFDQYGSLQFNKTNPRFVNYESNQTPVYIYRLIDMDGGAEIQTLEPEDPNPPVVQEDPEPEPEPEPEPNPDDSAVEEITAYPWAVGIDGDTIIAPEGSVIYDTNGRKVNGKKLGHGIYIVVGGGQSVKVVI